MRVFTFPIAPPLTIAIKSASQGNTLMSRFRKSKEGVNRGLTPSAD